MSFDPAIVGTAFASAMAEIQAFRLVHHARQLSLSWDDGQCVVFFEGSDGFQTTMRAIDARTAFLGVLTATRGRYDLGPGASS